METYQPKLKSYVYYAPVDEGVFIKGWNHEFIIKGNGLYPFIQSLFEQLDGHHTVEALTATVDKNTSVLIKQIITELKKRNMLVHDDGDGTSHGLTQTEQQLFTQTITFLEDRMPNAKRRFKQFRDQQMFVVGSGFALKALVRSLLAMGLRHISIAYDEETDRDVQLQQVIQSFREQDSSINVTFTLLHDWKNHFQSKAGEYDFSIVIMDNIDKELVDDYAQTMLDWDVPFICAGALWNEGVVGPLTTRTSATCWHCVYDALPVEETGEEAGKEAIRSKRPSPTRQLMIGHSTALEYVKYAFRLHDFQLNDHIVTISDTLTVQKHPVIVSPMCQHFLHATPVDKEEESSALKRSEIGDAPGVKEELLEQLEQFTSNHTGILKHVQPGKLPQIPLPHMQAIVHFPNRLGLQSVPIVAQGDDIEEARQNAIKEGIQLYTKKMSEQLMKNEMRLVSEDERLAKSSLYWSIGWTYEEWLGRGVLNSVWKHTSTLTSYAARRVHPSHIQSEQCQALLKSLHILTGTECEIFEVETNIPHNVGYIIFHQHKPIGDAIERHPAQSLKVALKRAIGYKQVHTDERKWTFNDQQQTWVYPTEVHDKVVIIDDAETIDWPMWVENMESYITEHHYTMNSNDVEAFRAMFGGHLFVGNVGYSEHVGDKWNKGQEGDIGQVSQKGNTGGSNSQGVKTH